jgi:hypothetical protein
MESAKRHAANSVIAFPAAHFSALCGKSFLDLVLPHYALLRRQTILGEHEH